MLRQRKLIFDAGLVFLVGMLASFFGYLIRMVLSRQLSLEEFGLFYSVFTLFTFFIVFRDLGLGQSLSRFIPQFMVKKQYGNVTSSIKFVFLSNFILSLLLAIIFLLFSDFLAINYFKSLDAKPLIYILAAFFVFQSLYNVFIAIFVGFQKSKLYSLELFLRNFIVFLLIILFSGKGTFYVGLSYLIAVFVGCLIFYFVLLKLFNFSKYSSRISKPLSKKLFLFGISLLFATVGYMVISQVDTLLLTYFRPLSEVGIYNVVLPTAILINIVGSSLGLAMLPLVSEFWSSKRVPEMRKIINNVYQKVFILIVPLAFILFIYSDLFLKVFFGDAYTVGAPALKVLSIGAMFFSFALINNNILAGIGKPKKITFTILIAAILNLILNFVLIPLYGMLGAAWATTVSYVFVLVLSTYFVTKSIKISLPIKEWFKIAISGLGFVVSVSILKNILEINYIFLEVFLVLLIGFLIYVALLLIFRIKINFLDLFRKRSQPE